MLINLMISLINILAKWRVRITGSLFWSTWTASFVRLKSSCNRNMKENPLLLSSIISGRWAGKRNLLILSSHSHRFQIKLQGNCFEYVSPPWKLDKNVLIFCLLQLQKIYHRFISILLYKSVIFIDFRTRYDYISYIWYNCRIIAVNYEARSFGVTRHMRGKEAKEKCPDIVLVSVPCLRGKADTSR